MNKTKTDIVIDAIFIIALLIAIIVLAYGFTNGWGKVEAAYEPIEVTEATEYITEPTEVEIPTTEATEAKAAIFDVPLDEVLQFHIISQAEAKGIDPAIVMAMCWKESTYNPNAIGDNGDAYGLLQVQPKWHYGRMQKLGCTDLLDPYQNVVVAVDYLAEQIDRYGDVEKGLTAYNAGHYSGTVTNYAKVVMAMANELGVA